METLAKLSDHAAARIDALAADGITLTPAEIVRVNALAWAVETGESRRLLSRGIPVQVGGAWLWPLTMHGSEWFSRVGLAMPTQALRQKALAYAFAMGRESGAALDIDGRVAQAAVCKWYSSLRCRHAELVEAMAQISIQDAEASDDEAPQEQDDEPGMAMGDLSTFLTAAAGGPPELWERAVSVGYAFDLMRTIVEQNKADDKPSATDPRIKAERALGLYLLEIKKAHADG